MYIYILAKAGQTARLNGPRVRKAKKCQHFFSKIELFSFKKHFLNPRATPSTSASKSVYI